MAKYAIFNAKYFVDQSMQKGSYEYVACEIFRAIMKDDDDLGDCFAMECESPSGLGAILRNNCLGIIELNPDTYAAWQDRYKEIYESTYYLTDALESAYQNILSNAESLSDLLEGSPELGEYELAGDDCVRKILGKFDVEYNMTESIASELKKIYSFDATNVISAEANLVA
jgi:hypothetical protein